MTKPDRARRLLQALRRHGLLSLVAAGGLTVALYLVAWPRVAGRTAEVVQPSEQELVQTVVSTGRVRPRRIRLISLVSAEVRQVAAIEGATVARGDLLVQLDDRETKAALAGAAAQLVEAQAQVRQLRTVSSASAAEEVTRARTNLADARLHAERTETLLAGGAVSTAAADQARTALALAESALRTATAQRDDVVKSGGRARVADARVQQAEAQVALAEARLGNTRITAPTNGVVIARSVEPGDIVQPGSPIVELAAREETELIVELDERNLSLLALGQPALASAEAYPQESFAARLTFISPIVDERRGTVEIRLAVAQPPTYLRPDMTVSVDIEVARKEKAMVLPLEAIRDLATKPWVLAIANGRAVRREITIGAQGNGRVEVLSGITPAELVVPVTQTKVSVGSRVRPKQVD